MPFKSAPQKLLQKVELFEKIDQQMLKNLGEVKRTRKIANKPVLTENMLIMSVYAHQCSQKLGDNNHPASKHFKIGIFANYNQIMKCTNGKSAIPQKTLEHHK